MIDGIFSCLTDGRFHTIFQLLYAIKAKLQAFAQYAFRRCNPDSLRQVTVVARILGANLF